MKNLSYRGANNISIKWFTSSVEGQLWKSTCASRYETNKCAKFWLYFKNLGNRSRDFFAEGLFNEIC